MVFPESSDPDPEVEGQARPPGKILPFVPRQKPDWLAGPSEELDMPSGEPGGVEREPDLERLPAPVLSRPGTPAPGPESRPERGGRRGEGAESASHAEPPRDPGEDDESRADPGASEAESPVVGGAVAWAAAASSIPVLKTGLPEVPLAPRDESVGKPTLDAPGPPGAEEGWQPAPSASPALDPLKEPWWLVALDALRSDRRLQIGAVAFVCVVLLALWLWPRGIGVTPLSQIRKHPAQYDGRNVTVQGRVGHDVFAMGDGWAFYLVQGRDTIVAYTRTARPEPHEAIRLKGQVSTGFLDGAPRQALFGDASGTR